MLFFTWRGQLKMSVVSINVNMMDQKHTWKVQNLKIITTKFMKNLFLSQTTQFHQATSMECRDYVLSLVWVIWCSYTRSCSYNRYGGPSERKWREESRTSCENIWQGVEATCFNLSWLEYCDITHTYNLFDDIQKKCLRTQCAREWGCRRAAILGCTNLGTLREWGERMYKNVKFHVLIIMCEGWVAVGWQREAVKLCSQFWTPSRVAWKCWNWVAMNWQTQGWSCCVRDWRAFTAQWRRWCKIYSIYRTLRYE